VVQSPSNFRNVDGDSHVGAYAPPRNDMRWSMVHQNAKLQFELPIFVQTNKNKNFK